MTCTRCSWTYRHRPAGPPPAARCRPHSHQPPPQPCRPVLSPIRPTGADHPGRTPCPGSTSNLDTDVDEQIQQVCAAERAAVCNLTDQPAFRVALIRTAPDRYRIVLTNHHIVLDGWSLPILMQEIFASYQGQQLPAAHRSVGSSPGWPSETSMPPGRPGARRSPASTPPPWSASQLG